MSTPLQPTDAELRILQHLWQHGPSTVRQVHEQIHCEKETGYTTTLKTMQIMTEKGLLSRDTSRRTHVYCAGVGQATIQQSMVSSLLSKAFDGSAARLVLQALGNHRTTPQELDAIRDLLNQLDPDND